MLTVDCLGEYNARFMYESAIVKSSTRETQRRWACILDGDSSPSQFCVQGLVSDVALTRRRDT